MAKYKHLESALGEIGRRIQGVWAERVGDRTGALKKAVLSSKNVQVTPRTVTIGEHANAKVSYAPYVESGHRQFRLPNRIRNWDVSSTGKLFKRIVFTPKGESKEIVRTITPSSKGWVIPKMEGKHNEVNIPRELASEIRSTLRKAATKDALDHVKHEVVKKFANGLKLKIKL